MRQCLRFSLFYNLSIDQISLGASLYISTLFYLVNRSEMRSPRSSETQVLTLIQIKDKHVPTSSSSVQQMQIVETKLVPISCRFVVSTTVAKNNFPSSLNPRLARKPNYHHLAEEVTGGSGFYQCRPSKCAYNNIICA